MDGAIASPGDSGAPVTAEALQQMDIIMPYLRISLFSVPVRGGIDDAHVRPYAVFQYRGKLLGHRKVQLITTPTGGNYLEKEEDIPCGFKPSSSVLFLILDIYLAAIFFLTFRYYAPLAMVVVSIGFFSTAMTPERCQRWALFYPLGITLPLALFPSMIMLMRVYALYSRSKLILIGLSIILLVQTIFGIWQTAVSGKAHVPDPIDNYDFHRGLSVHSQKILIPREGRASEVFVVLSLGYDGLVFFLTLGRTLYMFRKRKGRGPGSHDLVKNLVRDGALYFAVISSLNLFWTMVIFYAPAGLKGVGVIPSACVTAVVICRITLNLRVIFYTPDYYTTEGGDIPLPTLRAHQPTRDAVSQFSAASYLHTVAPTSIGHPEAEDLDEGHGWDHSELSESPRSLHKLDPDVSLGQVLEV
ncbi:hypothetical protein EVG20_g3554 [Dentipellis fragilis]|uniref:Uncharacterized protein n=1 Tax=Dentipellis fragilis TaxID=205917 RepID=A0A4Y9Z374_9AGAM|nr:hypothetical protein EVG20_g3554 [Dentipellis fragilis]